MADTIREIAKNSESVLESLTLDNIEQSDIDDLKHYTSEILSKLDTLETNNNVARDFINCLNNLKGLDIDSDIVNGLSDNANELY